LRYRFLDNAVRNLRRPTGDRQMRRCCRQLDLTRARKNYRRPDLEGRLPRLPDFWQRVILERDVILLDRRTHRILDIIENVIGLATGQ